MKPDTGTQIGVESAVGVHVDVEVVVKVEVGIDIHVGIQVDVTFVIAASEDRKEDKKSAYDEAYEIDRIHGGRDCSTYGCMIFAVAATGNATRGLIRSPQ